MVDVFTMLLIVHSVANAVIGEAFLPDQSLKCQFLLGSERESAFDVLNSFFKGNVCGRRDDEMEMVWHDYEFVDEETAFAAIDLKDIEL